MGEVLEFGLPEIDWDADEAGPRRTRGAGGWGAVGACGGREGCSCRFRPSSRSIWGTMPQVDRLMLRIPMLTPSGDEIRERNFITWSKLSSGSPMPMRTMWEMRSPMSFWAV